MSSAVIAAGIFSAAASTSGSNLFGQSELSQDGMHLGVVLTGIAQHLYYLAHRVSRALVPVHYSRATAFCPCFAPLSFASGIKRSKGMFLLSGMRKANCFVSSIVPTNVARERVMISTTSPSGRLPLWRA
jgi:hypothetical protein